MAVVAGSTAGSAVQYRMVGAGNAGRLVPVLCALAGAACASAGVSTSPENRLALDPAFAYVLVANVEGQLVRGEMSMHSSGDLTGAGFGFESCGGTPTDDSAHLDGRLLARYRIPRGRIRHSPSSIRVDCASTRFTIRRVEGEALAATLSVRVGESEPGRGTRSRWTPEAPVAVTLRRLDGSGARDGLRIAGPPTDARERSRVKPASTPAP